MKPDPSPRTAAPGRRRHARPAGANLDNVEPVAAAEAASGGDPDSPEADASLQTILICEDEASLRELVRAVLGPDYRYREAADGAEALELIRSQGADLVVLDLMLPRTSGFEVLKAMRREPATRTTPVVVLSAWSHFEDAATEAGADRFISKPFEPAELQAVVQELLRG